MLFYFFKFVMLMIFGVGEASDTQGVHHFCYTPAVNHSARSHACMHFPSLIKTVSSEDLLPDNRQLWAANDRLVWEDFQGTPDQRYPHVAALTASSITYKYSCEDGVISYEVEAIFRKDESWVRDENRTPYYLQHEQLHFDVTELYARKIRQSLGEKFFSCEQTAEFETLIEEHLEAWRIMEKKYDLETRYSNDKQMQKNWYVTVQTDLMEYTAYALAE
ncbi:MAG: hypothetical protein ACPGXL_00615 [Chitinophagales bacterium]